MTRSMNFDVTASGNAEQEFAQLGVAVERLEDKLRRLGQMTAEPRVDANITPATLKLNQLKTRLDAIRNVRAKVEIDGAAEARQDVTALVVEMRKIKDVRAKVELQTGTAKADVTQIASKLAAIRDTDVRLEVRTGQSENRANSIGNRLLAIKALSPVQVEIQVDPQDRALSRLAAILAATRALSAERPRIQVTADTAATATQLAALLAQVRALSNAQHTVRVQLEAQSLLAQLASIQTQLNTLAGGSIEITAETRQLMTQLAEARVELARLEAMDPTVVVQADTELARHRVEQLERQLHDIAAEQYHAEVDVDRNGSAAGKLVALSAASGLLVASLGSSTAAAASLAGSLVAVGGAAPVAAGGLMVAVSAVAAYRLGVMGLDEALSNLDDPEALAAAMERLSPAAQGFVRSVQRVRPAFDDMQLGVQERLLAGLGDQTERLGVRLLPSLRDGLGGTATELNLTAKELVGFATSAENISDIDAIFRNTTASMEAARPAATNILAALTDIGVVGTENLPALAQGWTGVTARFRDYIAEARRTGELDEMIDRGIAKAEQFGSVLGNSGSILVSVFDAADAAGADFLGTLDRGTEALARYLSSAEGNRDLVDFFRESRAVVDELTPGVSALTVAVTDTGSAFANTGGASAFAGALSDVAESGAPLLPMLGTLGGESLGIFASGVEVAAEAVSPLVDGLVALVDVTGPVAPTVIAAMAAFAGAAVARTAVVALSTSMAAGATAARTYALGLTGSAAAGQAVANAQTRVAGAVGAVGRALPIAAVAAIGIGAAYAEFGGKADEAADKVIAGSLSMQEAIAQEAAQIHKNQIEWLGGMNAQESYAAASANVRAEVEAQIATMGPLEAAQARAAIAAGNHRDAVTQFGVNSPQARTAADELTAANGRLELEQIAARNATDLHTAAMMQQADQALAATNADLGYERSLITLEQSQIRAAEAARNHGAGSLEARDAALAVEEAAFRAAAAAGEKARADGIAAGAANADELAVRAQRDELIRLAGQASGPTRQSLLDAAAAMDTQGASADLARIQAQAHKDELSRLAGQATGPTAGAMRDLARDFDNLGGANATAEQKARAQEDALRGLAATASGPLRTELLRMADQIRALPDRTVRVTAEGVLGGVAGRMAVNPQGGPREFASGGILPGYTPGRDVHMFASPTAGRLALSGGEAIMRPEFTRAVSPTWVHAANRAARAGGVGGVQSFIARTAPRAGAAEGRVGDGSRFATGGVWAGPKRPQRFATGGLFRTGPAYPWLAGQAWANSVNAMTDRVVPLMQARVKEEEARLLAASGSGPVTAGASAGLAWARTQVGKPYVWGGVGPGGYDCSGFMSAIVNVMRGRNPHSRVGATSSFPWGGFKPGIGPGLNIGSFKGSPGHMAGTIGGTNVESSGSVGVRVGGGARGAGNSMFTTRAHLADRGGMFASGTAALNLSGRAERALTGRQNDAFERLVAMLTTSRGRDYVRAPGPLPIATPTGTNPVADQFRSAMAVARGAGVAGPRLDVEPIARQVAALAAQLQARPPVVVNQNFPGGARPSREQRDAALGIRVALG